ncbi:unnamed protein product [Heligmosomoides polygyrus]|uniref:C2H2-type domain-containing protein n=1 Tax=Heligmosomoides polygyrus TaxID=6339 RepID=A0A183FG76_HELPZ|nr:unnamed protein product [Heligmosomoides polygyrus]
MLDEVDLSMQIEPLQNAINKLEKKIEQLGIVHQQGIEMLNFKLQSYERVFETLLQRTQPKSNCVFCSYEDNKDGHPTGRCCRFPDAVARVVQANVLQLCNKCLQQKHDEDCGFRCAICDQGHNICAEKEASDLGASLQELLDEHSLHRNMIAKKFHEKRSADELPPRRKRSIRHPADEHKVKHHNNPYLQGEILKTVQKKDGKNLW